MNNRTNKISDQYPPRDKWVLIDTPYCKYPATVARWNGVSWVASDNTEVLNVSYWQEIEF